MNFCLFCFLFLFCQMETYNAEKNNTADGMTAHFTLVFTVSYIVTERPRVVYFNKKFITNFSVTSRRYSRDDPLYYINILIDTLVTIGNNVAVDFYFYELQANRYHRTYVELHAKMCDFMDTSTLFGDTLKKAITNRPCPFQPGLHYFPNLTIPIKSISNNFPYRLGRLFCNTSITQSGAMSRLTEATIDLEVKVANRNKFTNKKGSQ